VIGPLPILLFGDDVRQSLLIGLEIAIQARNDVSEPNRLRRGGEGQPCEHERDGRQSHGATAT
jgi:hypothetical protein